MSALIQTFNLTHEYQTRTGEAIRAVAGVNLTIEEGEFVVIIGRNGSGKSTLAKHFNALLLPTEGQVLVRGIPTTDASQLWEIRRTVGMVFQNPDNQIVATTVEEDVAFGPENLGLPSREIRRRVEEALRAVDMLPYLHHAPHQLSGGQKQRVALAGVLAMEPACIVLDEATAMLDPVGRHEVMAAIHRLKNGKGISVVLITHFMDEAVQADRVLVMEEGRLLFEGTPRQVFTQVERLKEIHLDVPQVTELASVLAQEIPVRRDILSVEEMVQALEEAWGQ